MPCIYGDAALQVGNVFHRDRLDRRTFARPVLPEREQLLGLFQREAERAGPLDETQHMHVVCAIDTVIIVGAADGRMRPICS